MGISGIVWYYTRKSYSVPIADTSLHCSSARDRIANQKVAIKKLCGPFKTENIAKHMFREVRLLKQLRHENVCLPSRCLNAKPNKSADHPFARHIYLTFRRHVPFLLPPSTTGIAN